MSEMERLRAVIGFMLDRMLAINYDRTNPASWGWIARELSRLGYEVDRK